MTTEIGFGLYGLLRGPLVWELEDNIQRKKDITQLVQEISNVLDNLADTGMASHPIGRHYYRDRKYYLQNTVKSLLIKYGDKTTFASLSSQGII